MREPKQLTPTEQAMKDWHLSDFELTLQNFGENEGQYEGRIRFQNGEYESFSFKVNPDMAQPFIAIIADEIVKATGELGEKLKKSLGILNQPTKESANESTNE